MKVTVIDSHTGGEPTRVVLEGWPLPEGSTMAEKAAYLGEFQSDLRRGVVCEPRGHDVIVGALLLPPCDPAADFGVIFFNNECALGMCGHGLIGLVETLRHLGRVSVGSVTFDTPVGLVTAELFENGLVEIRNVESYRYQADVTVETVGFGEVKGDIAYGGNWFFLVKEAPLAPSVDVSQLSKLLAFTTDVMASLEQSGVTGENGAWINHVEVFAPGSEGNDSKNYVLCPGKQYDRSPCGTGTSAKLACLAADGKLAAGQVWRQESIIGSVFEARFDDAERGVFPYIKGQAYVMSEATLILNENDPFQWGFL